MAESKKSQTRHTAEDNVLRRMLNMPPAPFTPKKSVKPKTKAKKPAK